MNFILPGKDRVKRGDTHLSQVQLVHLESEWAGSGGEYEGVGGWKLIGSQGLGKTL